MKHKLLNVLVIMILFAGAIFSCRQEVVDLFRPGDKNIEDAQHWYEKNKPSQGIAMKSADLNGGKHNARPDWNHSYSRKSDDFTAVQVPLSVQGAFALVTPECKQAYEQTHDERYLLTLTQLVVVTPKDKDAFGFLMTIMPNKAYREANNIESFSLSYKHWKKDFSGYIFYHTLEGKFVNAWKFECGKPVKKVSQKSEHTLGLQLKSEPLEVCVDYGYELWSRNCTDYYTSGEYTGTTCSGWYLDGYIYAFTECYYTEPFYPEGGGGGDGGDGGYDPPCECETCPICQLCTWNYNSASCPGSCLGHLNNAFVGAFYQTYNLTTSNIRNAMLEALGTTGLGGRINIVSSSVTNPPFNIASRLNSEGQRLYDVTMNPFYFSDSNSLCAHIIIAHEMYHIYKFENGVVGGNPETNDFHHQSIVLDSAYKSMLMEMFPGHDNDYYEKLKYAGTLDSPVFTQLPQETQDSIILFLNTNEIP